MKVQAETLHFRFRYLTLKKIEVPGADYRAVQGNRCNAEYVAEVGVGATEGNGPNRTFEIPETGLYDIGVCVLDSGFECIFVECSIKIYCKYSRLKK